mmetsp:Transcript_16051/g.24428  ORF Transcript_16051/g.24428 Transcript_16051/m.24428 type:complete len:121 (+) Transcript_16051:143-505(+)
MIKRKLFIWFFLRELGLVEATQWPCLDEDLHHTKCMQQKSGQGALEHSWPSKQTLTSEQPPRLRSRCNKWTDHFPLILGPQQKLKKLPLVTRLCIDTVAVYSLLRNCYKTAQTLANFSLV